MEERITSTCRPHLMWSYPGRGCLTSKLKRGFVHRKYTKLSSELEGKLIRCQDMLGVVLSHRIFDGVVLHHKSVIVKCIHSLNRFKEVEESKDHVWYTPLCQILEGKLEAEARSDPERFLKEFVRVEAQVKAEKRDEMSGES